MNPVSTLSARTYLLAWIIAPVAIFVAIDTVTLYRRALDSVHAAYDRMLITAAHSIGDQLYIQGGRLEVNLPRAALEIFETNYSGKMAYRITGLKGEFIAGDADLPVYKGAAPSHVSYPDLVRIYDDRINGDPVRVAALFQPVISNDPKGTVLVQVAEATEHRERLAQKILSETLLHQLILIAAVSLVTFTVVTRALRPLETLKLKLDERRAEDLSPISMPKAPKELQPVVGALNQLMGRLEPLLDHQQRFVADASHQLRTPLAVLKTQLQSGLRGDAPAELVLKEMAGTVDRAIKLANQLLSLAKVEQLRGRGIQEICDLAMLARETAVDLSPLIGDKSLDFELNVEKVSVKGHPWMIGELISNLLHNSIRHTPAGGKLGIRTRHTHEHVLMYVWDSGPGLADEIKSRLSEPFATSHGSKGGGLGLTICHEIASAMNAHIWFENRIEQGTIIGLTAAVRFQPLSETVST